MRYLSIFSGVEAASLAWEPLGWEPLAFAEVDDFPSAVLAARYPDVPNLGDVTKVDWKEFVSEHGRPDVLVGGSPCQSFSIAGGRESLDGESRLMFEYIRACDEVRSPWIVWENVPGVLSARDNAFGQLVEELQKVGYVSLAWRVLDAQFFGVAQRRRRVFLVGHLGDGGAAAAVLLERESLCGNPQTSQEKREELARAARSGSVRSSGFKFHQGSGARGVGFEREQSPTLTADWHQPAVISGVPTPNAGTSYAIRTANTSANGCGVSEECSHTVDCAQPEALAYSIDYKQIPKWSEDVCHTLTHEGQGGIHSSVASKAVESDASVICRASDAANAETCVDMAPTLLSRMEKQPPFVLDRASFNQGGACSLRPAHRKGGDDGHARG